RHSRRSWPTRKPDASVHSPPFERPVASFFSRGSADEDTGGGTRHGRPPVPPGLVASRQHPPLGTHVLAPDGVSPVRWMPIADGRADHAPHRHPTSASRDEVDGAVCTGPMAGWNSYVARTRSGDRRNDTGGFRVGCGGTWQAARRHLDRSGRPPITAGPP